MPNIYQKTNISKEVFIDKIFSDLGVLDQEDVYNRMLDLIAKVCQLERVNTFSDERIK